MAYPLSASRLRAYQRCPQAYYYQYERGIKQPGFFGSASLGTALHQALLRIYRDWHYQQPVPPLTWIDECWQQHGTALSPAQQAEGREILEAYYQRFVVEASPMRKPLAVEGKVQGNLQIENLEFTISGRYDRLDWLEDGLELIDYKSGKEKQIPEATLLDVQIGLYFVALEQRYHQSLKQLSLLYLRTGEKISFAATSAHQDLVLEMIQALGNCEPIANGSRCWANTAIAAHTNATVRRCKTTLNPYPTRTVSLAAANRCNWYLACKIAIYCASKTEIIRFLAKLSAPFLASGLLALIQFPNAGIFAPVSQDHHSCHYWLGCWSSL
jgi:putative RecB family exonuclease